MAITINGSGPVSGVTTLGTVTSLSMSSGTISGLSAGGLPSSSVTQSNLASDVVPLGVGQTWQDVTGSRSYGTTYTNTTGRPIAVVISYAYNGSAGNVGQLTVGGVLITFGQTNAAYINHASGTAIVPSGSTYVFTSNFGSNTIVSWLELR